MAIIVEEDKNKVNVVRLLGWVAIFIVIGISVYYVFFAAPDLVTITPPPGFATIEPISQVSLQPSDVLNNATFQSLQQPTFALPTPSGPAGVGRSNPFVSP